MSGMTFDAVSAQVFEVDKRSGRTVGGAAFQASMGNLSAQDKKAKAAREAEENARIAGIVNALILKGDYKGVAEILKEKCGNCGGVSGETVELYEDEIADLKAELRGAESMADQYSEELETQEDRNGKLFDQMQELQAKLAEHRFYKQKVEFLEREHAMMEKNLKSNPIVEEEDAFDVNIDDLLLDAPDGSEAFLRAKIAPLLKSINRKDTLIKKLKGNAGMGIEEVLNTLNLTGDKNAAIKKILEVQQASVVKVQQQEKKMEKLTKIVATQKRREKHYQELQGNWKNQLKQMEKAVLACGAIHKRDQAKFTAELEAKDEQIMKLKEYLEKVNQLRQAQVQSQNSAMGKRIRTPSPQMKRRKVTKKRPARVTGESQRLAVPAL